jgi:hypothetical protein
MADIDGQLIFYAAANAATSRSLSPAAVGTAYRP